MFFILWLLTYCNTLIPPYTSRKNGELLTNPLQYFWLLVRICLCRLINLDNRSFSTNILSVNQESFITFAQRRAYTAREAITKKKKNPRLRPYRSGAKPRCLKVILKCARPLCLHLFYFHRLNSLSAYS